MGWTTEFSNDGIQALNSILAGDKLSFTAVRAGAVWDAAKALVDAGQATGNAWVLSLSGVPTVTKGENFVQIRAEVSNADVNAAMDTAVSRKADFASITDRAAHIWSFNVFARLDSGQDQFQFCTVTPQENASAIYVPPLSNGSFVLYFDIPIALSSTANVSVSMASSAYASQTELNNLKSIVEQLRQQVGAS